MGTVASQITSLTIVYSTVYSGADQSKHQSSASLAFVRGIHRGTVNSPHKWPVTRKMFPFDDVIMHLSSQQCFCFRHCAMLLRERKWNGTSDQTKYNWSKRGLLVMKLHITIRIILWCFRRYKVGLKSFNGIYVMGIILSLAYIIFSLWRSSLIFTT